MKNIAILIVALFVFSCEKNTTDVSSNKKKLAKRNIKTAPENNAVLENNTSNKKPNILLIITDDQGIDASAQYSFSNDLPNTPTLDALAKKGVVFDNAWATPACTTTRGTIITGQHGTNSGISYVPAVMDTDVMTLQRYLKSLPDNASYQTAVIGKWHLGGHNADAMHPNDSGLDYYAGNISSGVEDYYKWEFTLNGKQQTSTEYHTSKITDLAVEWLANQNEQQNPWFLWLAYAAPHSPFHLPPDHLHKRSTLTGKSQHIDSNKRDYYLAAIEAMDGEIGRLLDSMTDGDRENTLIVYMGDNGSPSSVIKTAAFDRKNGKGSLAEGGIRVPMVVSGKGVTRKNQREAALVNSTDLYATFLHFTGHELRQINDSYSFLDLLSNPQAGVRDYNYSEFESEKVTGWTVRNQEYKLIEYSDGTQALYNLDDTIAETENLLLTAAHENIVKTLQQQAANIRGKQNDDVVDITDIILDKRSANCADYVNSYRSTALDVNRQEIFNGSLTITVVKNKCVFSTNNIPNHHFNDADKPFPNNVKAQNKTFKVAMNPTHATSITPIAIGKNNAILLNGVKVDLLAAACFGVGDGKIGCNDNDQPWRYDPLFKDNGFRVDSHNAHSQPDGSYHYHGKPNALFDDDANTASPVVGFAADGYPILGSYFDDGTLKKARPSYRLKSGSRPDGSGSPGGIYDGTYRDDYEYVEGYGDLDECNGMYSGVIYGYYITDGFPYILSCYKGTPSPSFR